MHIVFLLYTFQRQEPSIFMVMYGGHSEWHFITSQFRSPMTLTSIACDSSFSRRHSNSKASIKFIVEQGGLYRATTKNGLALVFYLFFFTLTNNHSSLGSLVVNVLSRHNQ